MKNKILHFLFATLALVFCVPVQATVTVGEPHQTVRLDKSNTTRKPRSLVAWVDCYYLNGELSFDSFDDITNFTVTITDESNGQTAMFFLPDMSETVGISLSVGSYRIALRTFDGQSFEGILTISE